MKVAEILSALINQSQGQNVTINIGSVNIDTQNQSSEPDEQELEVMVPPLQQKIELLKKNAGLTNVYDEQADEDEPLE